MTIPLGSYPGPGRAASWRALFALHRTGFGEPPRRRDAGGLLPHRFTLAASASGERADGGLLSVPLSVGFRRLACASVLPCGVRTFLDARRRRGHPACEGNCTAVSSASSAANWLPHSGQKTAPPRACITNSPQTRH